MASYLLNSTVVSALAVAANLLFCSLAGYPPRLDPLRRPRPGAGEVVATILIAFGVVMIPLDLRMVQIGLRNTLWA
jgi:putative chitobiose transport system permease protein